MTATTDKARYFLEQSVPELKEFERKKILSPEEISSIARRRSDFEHKINARGSNPADYAHYAEFEINVEALRRKRVKRLGIKSSIHTGQRRIFFVFDRGNRKFPGEVRLWMQHIEYARSQKANKKLNQILTNVLRLHPAKPDLWIYAASYAFDDTGDMTEARDYMLRGLRFCRSSTSMWLEYIRLEIAYLAKIQARRTILGIGINNQEVISGSEMDKAGEEDDDDDNIVRLPRLTEADIGSEGQEKEGLTDDALRILDSGTIMSGGLIIAAFDSAMLHFKHDMDLAHRLFDIVAQFDEVPATKKVLNHILEAMRGFKRQSWHIFACSISQVMLGVSARDPGYPAALRQALRYMSEGISESEQRDDMVPWSQTWLTAQIQDDMDPALQRIITSKLRTIKKD